MCSLRVTIEKIKSLEEEKKSLLQEIEELKKVADQKALELESEVGKLRDEVKSLKVLMNGAEAPVAAPLEPTTVPFVEPATKPLA
jgi:uncharacterized coiled-coil DUF342 family protein